MTTTACPNCSNPVSGQYCSNCGQIQKDIRRFFLSLVNEALDDVFSINSRMWKTLVAILFRPGFLTQEYLKGRRVSYVQPIRLYLVTSISFFLLLSIVNFFSPPPALSINDNSENASEVEQVKDSAQDLNVDLAVEEDKNSTGVTTETDELGSMERALEQVDKAFSNEEVDVNLDIVSPERAAKLEARLQAQIKKAIVLGYEGGGELVSKFLEVAPPVIFCLLPLFALLLKLLYIFKGVYYTEHFIYAVHNHCFIFLTLLFYAIAEISLQRFPAVAEGLSVFVMIWIPVYLWISLKRVYGQGKFLTTLKFIGLGISYSSLLVLGVAVTTLIGLATL